MDKPIGRRPAGGRLAPTPSDDLEPRVAGLEAQVHKLSDRVRASKRDAAAARVLADAADRDVEEFRSELRDFRRATTCSFNTLRENLTDLRGHVDEQFGQVNNGFVEMRSKFDATAAGQQRIVELIEGLIANRG